MEIKALELDNIKNTYKDMQGNILKGHGREFAKFIFLTFDEEQVVEVKNWIASLVKNEREEEDIKNFFITCLTKQLYDTERFHKYKVPGGLFGSLYITCKGYKYLGIDQANWPSDPQFQAGMKASGEKLCDPDASDWEIGFQDNIHAMLLVAHKYEVNLEEFVFKSLSKLERLTVKDGIHVEHGNVINNEHNDGVEHFGYADGISQPIFILEDLIKMVENGQEDLRVWDTSAHPELVVVTDPGSEMGSGFGSYLVFRKLEQNVKAFKELEDELADKVLFAGDVRERAGALLVGRFEDGTPITMRSHEGIHEPIPNGFNYNRDQGGGKCPYQAHIRRVNPRGETSLQDESTHRIVRRGIPYGKRKPDLSDRPENEAGLLFMCFQKSISNQFEFIQAEWANNATAKAKGIGVDPIIGHGKRSKQDYPYEWGHQSACSFNFKQFVALKGGEYFFAPSISFLTSLASI